MFTNIVKNQLSTYTSTLFFRKAVTLKRVVLKIIFQNNTVMRFLFLAILFCSSGFCFAQDDYPDYRSKKDVFSRIQEKEIRSDVAAFSMGGLDESIGKIPLKTIPVTSATANSISFAGENIQVQITTVPFDASKHKLNYYDPEKTYLVRIDNKPFFGDYGTIPKTTVENVTVIVGNDTIKVPQLACSDLCNPVLSFTEKGVLKTLNKVYLSADGKRIYVYLLKPEAGGSYESTWVVSDKKYARRVVDFGFLR